MENLGLLNNLFFHIEKLILTLSIVHIKKKSLVTALDLYRYW